MIKPVSLILTALCLAATVQAVGQAPASPDQESADAGDPIAAMLDSLVTLNKVLRFNSLNTANEPADEALADATPVNDSVYQARISAISTPIPLVYNEEVRQYIDLYAVKKRSLTARVLGLSDLYFPMFEEILDRERLPEELKYLAIVESALNPVARSRVGATGIWQFMYNTGKLYQLRVNSYTDERRDPLKATEAACRYFRDMYAIYKDWLLVIAAYNCGAGNVNRAIVRSGGRTDFWEIHRYLPRETRGYVPAFMAVCYVMKYAQEHRIEPVPPAYSYFEVDTVWIDDRTSLSRIASTVDLPLEVVQYLNPVYKRGIIPSTGEQQLVRLPANRIAAFLSGRDRLFAAEPREEAPVLASLNLAGKAPDGYEYVSKRRLRTHHVRRGESLGVISERYDCSISQIRKLNNLSSTRIYAGQRLKVYAWVKEKRPVAKPEAPTTVDSATAAAVADSNKAAGSETAGEADDKQDIVRSTQQDTDATPDPGRYVYHVVQKGDTLWKIASMYEGATIRQIMELNRITEVRDLKTGMRLKVMITG